MIRQLIISSVLLVVFSAHGERDYEYKCWVTLTNGNEMISFQKLDTRGEHRKAKSLLLKERKVQAKNGPKAVAAVHECVELNENFIQMKARELDKVTTR